MTGLNWVLRNENNQPVLATVDRHIAESYLRPGYTLDWEGEPDLTVMGSPTDHVYVEQT